MPGEFVPDMVKIGIDNCRSGLQHYYAIGGNKDAFAIFKGHVVDITLIGISKTFIVEKALQKYLDAIMKSETDSQEKK